MKLEDINDTEKIFIDANIFLSEIFDEETADECMDFLERVKDGGIRGFTSVIVLNEIFHRVAIAQVYKSFKIPLSKASLFLKENPDKFKSLGKPWEAIQNIVDIHNMVFLEVDRDIFRGGMEFSREYGLLSNDALHLAVMKEGNIDNLASNDKDFERIGWIKLYKTSRL